MVPPMCPRPTKPILVDVVVGISRLPSIVATSFSPSERSAGEIGST